MKECLNLFGKPRDTAAIIIIIIWSFKCLTICVNQNLIYSWGHKLRSQWIINLVNVMHLLTINTIVVIVPPKKHPEKKKKFIILSNRKFIWLKWRKRQLVGYVDEWWHYANCKKSECHFTHALIFLATSSTVAYGEETV